MNYFTKDDPLKGDALDWNVEALRSLFPALNVVSDEGLSPVYFDGPAGSQTPASVVEAIGRYLTTMNANHGGVFATSRASDALLDEAHLAMSDLVGADDPGCIVFGGNMTTLTLAFSRALSHDWKPGDEVVVTNLDHDANVTPWVLAARDRGATVRRVPFHAQDGTLDREAFRASLGPRTRLVAIGAASNAIGTINPVAELTRLAHDAGAEVFVDAVHFAPHRRIDVRAWDCDYLACSAYKFFGPHVGILWGRRERLESLPAYKVRPAPDDLPGRWMTGTQNHEGIAGVLAAVEYLADLGRALDPDVPDRRAALDRAFEEIARYEEGLTASMLEGFARRPSLTVYGITDPARLAERVPTFSVRHRRLRPNELAEYLDSRGIYVWNGNFYAQSFTEQLGLEPDGVVRIGLVHYNTPAEIERLFNAIDDLDAPTP